MGTSSRKHDARLLALVSLLTLVSATDCEILNSGISVILAENCCTMNEITCVNGRVIGM
jgi:hypothetical protein